MKYISLRYCIICGGRDSLHKHHLIPRCKGGSNEPSNIVSLCQICHILVHNGWNSIKKPKYNAIIGKLIGKYGCVVFQQHSQAARNFTNEFYEPLNMVQKTHSALRKHYGGMKPEDILELCLKRERNGLMPLPKIEDEPIIKKPDRLDEIIESANRTTETLNGILEKLANNQAAIIKMLGNKSIAAPEQPTRHEPGTGGGESG
jgi:hypothetical protein